MCLHLALKLGGGQATGGLGGGGGIFNQTPGGLGGGGLGGGLAGGLGNTSLLGKQQQTGAGLGLGMGGGMGVGLFTGGGGAKGGVMYMYYSEMYDSLFVIFLDQEKELQ